MAVLAGDGVAGVRDGDAIAGAVLRAIRRRDRAGRHDLRLRRGRLRRAFARLSPDGDGVHTGRRRAWLRRWRGRGGAFRHAVGAGRRRRRARSTSPTPATTRSGASRLTERCSTLAGDGTAGRYGRSREHAQFNGPIGVAVDRTGRVDRRRHLQRSHPRHRHGRRRHRPSRAARIGRGRRRRAGDAASTPRAAWRSTATERIVVADTGNGVVRARLASGCRRHAAVAVVDGLRHPTGIAVDAARRRLRHRRPRPHRRNLASKARPGRSPARASGFRDGAGADARLPPSRRRRACRRRAA